MMIKLLNGYLIWEHLLKFKVKNLNIIMKLERTKSHKTRNWILIIIENVKFNKINERHHEKLYRCHIQRKY